MERARARMDGRTLPTHHRIVQRTDKSDRIGQRISILKSVRADTITKSGVWLVRLLSSCFAATDCVFAVFMFRFLSRNESTARHSAAAYRSQFVFAVHSLNERQGN